MLTWFTEWRERRRRMQWFANEFLPALQAAAQESGGAVVAGRLVDACRPAPEQAEAATASAGRRVDYSQNFERLEEVLRRIPESERERLKAFVKAPSGF